VEHNNRTPGPEPIHTCGRHHPGRWRARAAPQALKHLARRQAGLGPETPPVTSLARGAPFIPLSPAALL